MNKKKNTYRPSKRFLSITAVILSIGGGLAPIATGLADSASHASTYTSSSNYYTLHGAIGNLYRYNSWVSSGAGALLSNEYASANGGARQDFAGGSIYWHERTGAQFVRNGGIKNYYESQGAEKSDLGYPVSSVYRNGLPDNGWQLDTFNPKTGRSYSLVWSDSHGARTVYKNGAIGGLWTRNSSQQGQPITNEASTNDGGYWQAFKNGVTHWTPRTGSVFLQNGGLRSFFEEQGGSHGYLGFPTTGEYPNNYGGASFESLNLKNNSRWVTAWTPEFGSQPVKVTGAIGAKWSSNKAFYGSPRGPEKCESNGACWQSFKNFDIAWTPQFGAVTMTRSGTYNALVGQLGGYGGKIGAPINEIKWVNNQWGWGTTQSFFNPFTKARYKLVFHRDLGIRTIYENGAIGSRWNSMGAENSWLGFPKTNEEGLSRGAWQSFDGGAIFWSPTAGTHTVDWEIWNVWSKYSRENGSLGYPTSSKYNTANGARQDFEGGYILNGQAFFKQNYSESEMNKRAQEIFGNSTATSGILTPIGDGSVRAKTYSSGVVVWSPGFGYVAMSYDVYNHWVKQKSYAEFSNFDGMPKSQRWVGPNLYTQFENTELFYDPSSRLVRNNKQLTSSDAIVIGDSQVWENSWVGLSIKDLGYKPDFYRCGGVGFVSSRPGACPSYSQGVLENTWALPLGNPGVVYIAASGNDSWQSDGDILAKQDQVVKTLKRLYPNSKIVVQGVISDRSGGHARRWVLDDQARQTAANNGVKFISPKYMNTDFALHKYLEDGIHFQDRYQRNVANFYTPKLRELVATNKASVNVSY